MIVQVRNHSSVAGSFQPSHKPANTNGAPSFMPIAYGIFPANDLLPLVKGVHRDEASSLLERLAKGWCSINTLGPHIDGPVRNFRILSPVWDQSPPQRIKATLLSSGLNRIARTSWLGAIFQLIGKSRCAGIG